MSSRARVVLVRHGRPTAGWGDDPDPGLSPHGIAQAEAMADALAPLGPLPVLVSALRRTRETAAPLEARWQATADIEPAVGELRAPPDARPDHHTWLRTTMASRWPELAPDLDAFRARVLDRLLALDADCVVVTHFVAINVAVGAATGDDRVVGFAPDHCSRTVIEVREGRLHLVELGATAATEVLPGDGRGP